MIWGIVTGGNHHNTYGVVRALGKKGIRIFLLLINDDSQSFLLKSRYVSRYEIVKNEVEAITYLQKHKKNFNDSVIIACSDGMSSALDKNFNSLIDSYRLPGATEQGRISTIMDKETMSRLGKSVGFNVPDSKVVSTLDDIEDIAYPCITKPILSIDGHKSDITICYRKEDLVRVIKTGTCHTYQVQKFIKKDFEYQLIGLSLNGGERLIIPGFSRCIRPCPSTNTGFLHYESLNNASIPLEKCRNFVKATGYSGLFSIEFLRDKQGNDFFMEMNFRNDGNAICVTASGTNLPYIWYLANTGGDYVKEIENSKFRPVYAMPEFPDFENFVYKRRISVLRWVRDVARTHVFMIFTLSDIHPFFYCLRSFIKRAYRKLCKKV